MSYRLFLNLVNTHLTVANCAKYPHLRNILFRYFSGVPVVKTSASNAAGAGMGGKARSTPGQGAKILTSCGAKMPKPKNNRNNIITNSIKTSEKKQIFGFDFSNESTDFKFKKSNS